LAKEYKLYAQRKNIGKELKIQIHWYNYLAYN
jgi:hypothetical protein